MTTKPATSTLATVSANCKLEKIMNYIICNKKIESADARATILSAFAYNLSILTLATVSSHAILLKNVIQM